MLPSTMPLPTKKIVWGQITSLPIVVSCLFIYFLIALYFLFMRVVTLTRPQPKACEFKNTGLILNEIECAEKHDKMK